MSAAPDIRTAPGEAFPPGPPMLPRFLSGRAFRENPLDFLTENARRYGDFVHFRGPEGHAFQFNHPTLIGEIMVEHERRNRRALVMQRARVLLGEGLLTSEEPLHMRQRRLAAPAFHRERIAGYGEVIGRYAVEISQSRQPGPSDLHPQMLLVALRIVGKCLFNIDNVEEARRIAAAVKRFMVSPPPVWIPGTLIELAQKLPFGPMIEVRRGIDALDAILYGMIAERRADPGDRGDLLSMLLAAEDQEETAGDRTMSDKQVRDECLTVLLAGHETTANALSFALWLLATHPEEQETARREAVEVLGNGAANASDFPLLRHTYAVFAEAMRLYPTVWVLGRAAGPEPYRFHGCTIPPGATLLAPQSVVHRDPRFWDEPDRFKPSRFMGDSKRPKFAYFPFGGGSRQCIGEGLAWMEGTLVLATILRDWRLRPLEGAPAELPINASINLRPRKGVHLQLERC